MYFVKTHNKRRILIIGLICWLMISLLFFRVLYIMVARADDLQDMAYDLHNRERVIEPERGMITDRNNVPLAVNRSVSTVYVIHNQIEDEEAVINMLCKELDLEEEYVRERVEKRVALSIIKTNVESDIAKACRRYKLKGVIIDESFKRYYPYDELASHVIGFVGKDNQGIIGLEVVYDQYLKGKEGLLYTTTNAKGIEIDNLMENRIEAIDGYHLQTSIDINIQKYAEQALEQIINAKKAKRGSIVIMNPQNGEIYAMTNKPDFNLNDPFYLENDNMSVEEKTKVLNQIWRNYCINDTYEPGSTFKVITGTAGIEEKVVALDEHFFCRGSYVVAGKSIRCHKDGGHGSETFVEGFMNSCNPVFIIVGERLGVDRFLKYYDGFGFNEKTGIDLPGEAVSIMHKKENIGPVELATMSFGQSFQVTPLQLLRGISSVINGGRLVTPHFGVSVYDRSNHKLKDLEYDEGEAPIHKETSETVKIILEKVVSEGTGKNCAVEGYEIGGKTATSEKLPRSARKYISSFVGFAPADDPQLIVLVLIEEPEGVHYGGTVAAPVAKSIFENILPYLGYDKQNVVQDDETE